jgi:hypothetical protein
MGPWLTHIPLCFSSCKTEKKRRVASPFPNFKLLRPHVCFLESSLATSMELQSRAIVLETPTLPPLSFSRKLTRQARFLLAYSSAPLLPRVNPTFPRLLWMQFEFQMARTLFCVLRLTALICKSIPLPNCYLCLALLLLLLL